MRHPYSSERAGPWASRCVLAGLLIFGLAGSWLDLVRYTATDLDSRIVGAKRLLAGLNPYLEPAGGNTALHSSTPVSVSPLLLAVQTPFAGMSIHTQRVIFFVTDWLSLLGALLLISKLLEVDERRRNWALAALLTVFSASLRLHFARAQTYLLLLLLTVALAYGIQRAKSEWKYAAVLSFLIVLRPTYVLVLGGLFFTDQRSLARRTALTLGMTVALLVLSLGASTWLAYFEFVQRESGHHVELALGDKVVAAPPGGVDHRKFLNVRGFEHDRTLIGVFGFSPLRSLARNHLQALGEFNFILLIVSTGFCLALSRRFKTGPHSYNAAAFLFLLPLIAELFGPQKYAYSDVLLLLPVCLIAREFVQNFSYRWLSLGFIAASVVGLAPWVMPSRILPALSAGGYMLSVVLLVVVCSPRTGWRRRLVSTEEAHLREQHAHSA